VYTAKLVGGFLGLGAASSVVASIGYTGAYTIAGVIAVLSAVIAAFLRQPGRGPGAPGHLSTSFDPSAGPLAGRDRPEPA
jgi:hypothetical protein